MDYFGFASKWKEIVKFFAGDTKVKITTYTDGERRWTIYRNI